MGLQRKRESIKNYKIIRGVFDERTLIVLYKLLNRTGVIVESLVKEGKESVILSGLNKENEWVALKIYRTEACDFKNMWKYLVGDPRFFKLKKSRRSIVNAWCRREFKNLKIAYESKVRCPKPIDFEENILMMSFIGEDGIPAPRLIDIEIENLEEVYKDVLKNLERMVKNGLVHGDLSAYNILFFEKAYFIDFSHGTTVDNPIAPELLKRDIKNLNLYFSKSGVEVRDEDEIYERLKKIAGF